MHADWMASLQVSQPEEALTGSVTRDVWCMHADWMASLQVSQPKVALTGSVTRDAVVHACGLDG